MKNNYKLFIIFFLFLKTICDDDQDNQDTLCKGTPSSVNDCQDLLSIEEKSYNKSCCFFTSEQNGIDNNQCILLDEDNYNNINLVKEYYISKGYSNVDIDCRSFYFKLDIISFYLFLIFSIY